MLSLALEFFHQRSTGEPLRLRNRFRFEDTRDHYFICVAQTLYQFLEENVAAKGVRPWLKDRPQTPSVIVRSQGLEGFRDGGGMVGEVIDNSDRCDLGRDFRAELHARDCCQGFVD